MDNWIAGLSQGGGFLSTLNWIRISELMFEGLVQGLVSAIIILAAYFMGKKRRENEYLARTELLKEQNEILKDQVDEAQQKNMMDRLERLNQ